MPSPFGTDENAHNGIGMDPGAPEGAGTGGESQLSPRNKLAGEPMVPLRRYQEVELLLREEQKRKNRALNALKTAEENLKKMAEDMETMKNVNKAQLAILKKQFQKQIDKKNAYIEDLRRKVEEMKSRELVKREDPPEVTCGSFVNSTPFGERILNLFRSLVTPSPDPPARAALEGPTETPGIRPALLPRMHTESPVRELEGMEPRYDMVARSSLGSTPGAGYGSGRPPRASRPSSLPDPTPYDSFDAPQSIYHNPSSPLFPTPR
eukprot:tig00000241_g20970.t1